MYRFRMDQIASSTVRPANFQELIGRWPTTRAFARDAGCSPTLVRQWRHRDFVPAPYWTRILEGAARRGITFVDSNLLAQLAAKRRVMGKGAQR
jgi:hypothetical protein